eukprot:XP_011412699.1 PREDICTED: uncharacterized protein LOC105317677 [Crassostrea gigas]
MKLVLVLLILSSLLSIAVTFPAIYVCSSPIPTPMEDLESSVGVSRDTGLDKREIRRAVRDSEIYKGNEEPGSPGHYYCTSLLRMRRSENKGVSRDTRLDKRMCSRTFKIWIHEWGKTNHEVPFEYTVTC